MSTQEDANNDQNNKPSEQTSKAAENSTPDPQQTSSSESSPAAETQPKASKYSLGIMLSKKWRIIILSVVVVISGATAWYFIHKAITDRSQSNTQTTDTVSQQTSDSIDTQNADLTAEGTPIAFVPAPRPNYNPLSGATWFNELRPLEYQPVFTDKGLRDIYGYAPESTSQENFHSYVSFFEAGTYQSKQIIVAVAQQYEVGDPPTYYLTKSGDTFTLYEGNSGYSYSEQPEISYWGPELSPSVTINKTDTFVDVVLQDAISFQNLSLERVSIDKYLEPGNEILGQLTKIGDSGYGSVYQRISSSSDWVSMAQIYLKQSSGLYVGYRFVLNTPDTQYINDDNSIPITWNDGSSTTDSYQWALVRYGCGMFASVNVLPETYRSDLEAAGTTKDKTVYTFKSPDSAAFSQIYESYNPTDWPIEGRESKQQVFDNKGIVVIENALGQYVILAKSQYQSAGECAKPVIYLYPEKPTFISVSVGAAVRISEPQYNNGWNVLAFPNGSLLNGSSVYKNLFWEGTGVGDYPDISGKGFVVSQSVIEPTLREHLQKLGLNQQEAADFMEYWLPLMPDTPYIRLSWLGTQDMNRLAPLTLSQEPDTLIRIFLDFEGLDTPIELTPQRLGHPERKGFTVVEWGGLRK